jgi:hypothetical protein
MLKVGDKCIWAQKAIRRVAGKDRATCRKQVLKVVRIKSYSPYRVMLEHATWDKWIGWYLQRDLVKL